MSYQAAPPGGYKAAPSPGYQAAPPGGYQAAPQPNYVHQSQQIQHHHHVVGVMYAPPSGISVVFAVLALLTGIGNLIIPITLWIQSYLFISGWAWWVLLVGGACTISGGLAVLGHHRFQSSHRRHTGTGGLASGGVLTVVSGGFLAAAAAQGLSLVGQVMAGAVLGLVGGALSFLALATFVSSTRVVVHV